MHAPSGANTLAPEDLAFKLYRAEALSGLKRCSDALSDLSDLCSLHPSWIEVSDFYHIMTLLSMRYVCAQCSQCCKSRQKLVPSLADLTLLNTLIRVCHNVNAISPNQTEVCVYLLVLTV